MPGSEQVSANMKAWQERTFAALFAVAQNVGARMEAEAKNPGYPVRPLRPDEMSEDDKPRKGRKAKSDAILEREVKPVSKGDIEYKEFADGQTGQYTWRDITAHARQSIFAETIQDEGWIKTRVAHGKEYGVYLELAMQRRFAVLEPVAKKWGPKFVELARRLIQK